MGKHRSTDYKLAAISYYKENGNMEETCRVFHCKARTLKDWVIKFNASGNVENITREGSYKVTYADVQFLLKQIQCNPDVTLHTLRELLSNI